MPQLIDVPGHGVVEFPDGMSDAQIVAAIQKNTVTPAQTQTLPANSGVANLAATVLGLPGETVKNIANLGIAGYGTVKGLLGGTPPDLIQHTHGDIADVKQMMRSTGQPGLSPDNPTPNSKVGTAAYNFTSRGGFIPGGAIPAAGSMVAEKLGGPQWAPVGAMVPQAAITGYNAMRAPGLARQESQNAVRDQTFKEGQQAGYVVPPSAAGGGFVSKRMESLGGKAAIGQEAAVRNQKVTNDLARKAVGLPKDSAISVQALEAQREKFSAPYREVSGISKDAASALEQLKQTRFDANNYFRHYDVSADPASLAKAKELSSQAAALEKMLEGIAKGAGKPDLVNELRAARQNIAKTYDVERALNVATGDVSAPVLGKMVDKGKPLTGGLQTAGKFQQAFPQYMREGQRIPTPGVSKSEALASAILGLGGYGTMGTYGAALGTLPLLSGPARSLLLSRLSQSRLAPSYGPALSAAPNPLLAGQLGILSQPQY